ncbi:DoxX family protein [Paenibacillus sp. MMS20-IR301]|uniref:DoxX family protein n=1 Tax=Paenibacillus sp. MMS20-IR301 TaxID=2895946 RepID=UPI0028EC48D3|nr:DoxX family protein [Paenibacillus sp. MMS20-IR301]WNS46346.1 DoxX family protein [Paenibacillus sp. MMS20-IR301]
MVPFIALIVSFLLFQVAGFLGLTHWNDWYTSLQWAVSIMLLLSASAHWGRRRSDLVRMVPPAFPQKERIVTVTGILEIAGALGMLLPSVAPVASVCLVVLLIAMLPANIHAARNNMTVGGRPVPRLPVRIGIQLVFITAILIASPLFQ